MVNSLFMIHCSANTGYAIQHIERVFYTVGLELAGGDKRGVHFCYKNYDSGLSTSLPNGFDNLTSFDYSSDMNSYNAQVLVAYVQKHNIQVVVAFDLQPDSPICRLLKQAGVSVIVAYWGAPISSINPLWKVMLKRLFLNLTRYKANGLIFESTALAAMAIKGRGVPLSLVDVIPLGVDTERFYPSTSVFAHEEFDFPLERKIVICAGHVYEGKGNGVLVDAAIRLLTEKNRGDVCFLFLGNKGIESKVYEDKYANTELEPFIRFGGYRSDIEKLYRGCFCGIVPSLVAESFAFSGVEMAASGLPVIASRIGGLTDSVADGETGMLVDPGSVNQLSDAIEYLLDNEQLASQYGKNGRTRCEKLFSINVQHQNLVNALKKRISGVIR